jgi:hypothetical protein
MDRGRLKTSGAVGIAGGAGDGYVLWKDLALCAWFLIAALGFFGPYLGLLPVALPTKAGEAPALNPLTPAFALFLLLSVLVLALRLLKGRRSVPAGPDARQ